LTPDQIFLAERELESKKESPVLFFLSFTILSSVIFYLLSVQKEGSTLVPLTVQS
jgi:hypothetical protein